MNGEVSHVTSVQQTLPFEELFLGIIGASCNPEHTSGFSVVFVVRAGLHSLLMMKFDWNKCRDNSVLCHLWKASDLSLCNL